MTLLDQYLDLTRRLIHEADQESLDALSAGDAARHAALQAVVQEGQRRLAVDQNQRPSRTLPSGAPLSALRDAPWHQPISLALDAATTLTPRPESPTESGITP